jgi:hypothetical protein
MTIDISVRVRSNGIFEFISESLNLTIIKIKLWHGIAIAATLVLVLFDIDALEPVYRNISIWLKPMMPVINIILQLLPFIIIAFIWTLRKLLDKQLEGLAIQLAGMSEATDEAAKTIKSSSKAMVADTMTAAGGLSRSAIIAASDVAGAADQISVAADAASQSTIRAANNIQEQAELARLKLEQQSERLKNEIDRLSEDLGTRTEQIISRLRESFEVKASGVEPPLEHKNDVAAANWERARAVWQDTRNDLAGIIDYGLGNMDGRKARHLKFDYRNYGAVAKQLEDLKVISVESRGIIEEMNARFNRLKSTWSTITQEDVDALIRLRESFRSLNPSRA